MKTSIIFSFWLISMALFSQNIVWEKAYDKSRYDKFGCIRSTPDGGCIWGGEFQSDYYTDSIYSDENFHKVKGTEIWVVKLNALGDTEWEKAYGDSSDNSLLDIQRTQDGGYILLGNKFYEIRRSGRLEWERDALVVKINSTGEVEWEKYYPKFRGFLGIKIIHQTKDGGYILGGSIKTRLKDSADIHISRDDMLVYKIDSKGNIQWQETNILPKSYYLQCILQVSDGGYLLGGFSSTSDGEKGASGKGQTTDFLIKLNSKGKIKWEKSYGGSENFLTFDIQPSPDGGYFLGGACHPDRILDFGVLKINSKWLLQWKKYYGGSKVEALRNIVLPSDNTLALSGTARSSDGDVKSGNKGGSDNWLVKIDTKGRIIWEKSFGGSNDDRLGRVELASNGGYFVGGETDSQDGDVKSTNKTSRTQVWIVKVKE